MSHLSNPIEAAAWVISWREHYATRHAGPVNLAKRLRRAATEQRAVLEGCRSSGYQGEKGRAAYLESVEMLEAEATKAEAAAEVWRAEELERKAAEEAAADARRAELMAKYPAAPR